MVRIALTSLALLVSLAIAPLSAQAGFGVGKGSGGGKGGGKNFSRSSITKHLQHSNHSHHSHSHHNHNHNHHSHSHHNHNHSHHNHHHPHHNHHHHPHHHHKYYPRPVYVQPAPVVVNRPVDHCHHPFHCHAYVLNGDSFVAIAAREYGNANFAASIATFNSLPLGTPLVAGQMIQLPAIYDSGRMVPSNAPVPPRPTGFAPRVVDPGPAGPTGGVDPLQANVRQAPARPAPQFTTGSSLVLDGKEFGKTPGEVRLLIGPLAIPVAIENWSASEVGVTLPMLELAGPADAEMIVINSEGKIVTKSKLRLVASQEGLALEN